MPLSRSLIFIFLSVIVISGPAFLGFLYYQSLKAQRVVDDRYLIRKVVQLPPKRHALETEYLCELLDLSSDHPMNLFQLNRIDAKERLQFSPLIKEAHVTKVLPDKLLIEYSMRRPLAMLGDYENVAIDYEGYPFPYDPFYPSQKLPVIYLGDVSIEWNEPIRGPKIQTAMKVYNLISSPSIRIKQIDVSQTFATSYGKREIVAIVEEKHSHLTTLRLDPENLEEATAHFETIQKALPISQNRVIDLRISNLAFLS